MADARKIDPFDVEALEKSLNDSATRVSTIWVSFVLFSLYLLTAATTVTHRQLFLAEPVKLPVFSIDLPLWGFFWLAPILFVIFHAYVLIQLILLARTAAAYDAAVAKFTEQDNLSPEANASLRQRLANTLFAQILAGSPREREGWFGSLLKAMAWITLVIGPILILLTFQFMFLPYHSHFATWTHRFLILLEFVVAFQVWPLVLNPQRDFRWPNWRWRINGAATRIGRLFRLKKSRRQVRQGLQHLALPMAATVLFVLLSLSLATFPGEPHVNLFTGQALDSVQCKRSIQQSFDFADMRFDRLALARVDVIDHEKLEKIQQATSKAGERPYQGERTRILRDRDLNCADFSGYADLRRTDFGGARLIDADFRFAKLEGVSFGSAQLQDALLDNAQLQGASFKVAQLQRVSLIGAKLQGAFLDNAQLQGASLISAELQGASLVAAQLQGAQLFGAGFQDAILDTAGLQGASVQNAHLQGASLIRAQLQGAVLDGADLQGASLDTAQMQGASLARVRLQGASLGEAQLQGAFLDDAQLQGAFLVRAELQGASLARVQLQGASLDDAQLQGTSFKGADLGQATLIRAKIWRARDANCDSARIVDPRNDAIGIGDPILTAPDKTEQFITNWVADIPEQRGKEDVRKILRERLTVAQNDTAALGDLWSHCERKSRNVSRAEFDGRHLAVLRGAVCDARSDGAAIGKGIARNWISDEEDRREFNAKLAHALLGEDGKPCAAAKNYDEDTKMLLREAAGPPPAIAAPK
jgi:uncharacterized protein YjbI with pentapeptide repeats